MGRIVRPYNVSAQVLTTVVTVGTSTGTVAVTGLRPPAPGARVEKWWVTPQTAGSGTGTLTSYLAFAGGTSSTSAITGVVAIDPAAAAGTLYEVAGNSSTVIPNTALDKDCVFITTAGTTNTAPALLMGIIWRL